MGNGVNSFATGLQKVYFMKLNFLGSFLLILWMLEFYIIMGSQQLFLNHWKIIILRFFVKDYRCLKNIIVLRE